MPAPGTVSPEEYSLWQALKGVMDPEIPIISVVDLGIITKVEVGDDGHAIVHMTPTFAGCPAIEVMRKGIEKTLADAGYDSFEVQVEFKTTWDSNRISEAGKQQLVKFGLGRPEQHEGEVTMEMVETATCPFCESSDTDLQSPFGSALCRSIHYCHQCRQTFERFKPV